MEKYLTYAEYIELGGNIPEMPFNVLEFKAEKIIDKYTYGRLKKRSTQINEVKHCMYELINLYVSYETKDNVNKNVASVNTDGYSESYITTNKELLKSKNKELFNCVEDYLNDCKLEDGTPYLYI